jgi:hypothetical protein
MEDFIIHDASKPFELPFSTDTSTYSIAPGDLSSTFNCENEVEMIISDVNEDAVQSFNTMFTSHEPIIVPVSNLSKISQGWLIPDFESNNSNSIEVLDGTEIERIPVSNYSYEVPLPIVSIPPYYRLLFFPVAYTLLPHSRTGGN